MTSLHFENTWTNYKVWIIVCEQIEALMRRPGMRSSLYQAVWNEHFDDFLQSRQGRWMKDSAEKYCATYSESVFFPPNA